MFFITIEIQQDLPINRYSRPKTPAKEIFLKLVVLFLLETEHF